MLDDKSGHERHVRVKRRQVVQTALVAAIVAFLLWRYTPRPGTPPPPNAADLLAKCYALDMPAGPPLDFSSRTESDRYVPGTRATVVRNATIWTGGDAGTETVRGDVLLDAGMIKAVGNVPEHLLRGLEYDTLDAKGLWLTPGLVDAHSHLGVFSQPFSNGASGDFMTQHGPIAPWLRVVDGLNTHDASVKLAIAGGTTSALILPGSGNSIGGQAFAIKLRGTAARTPSSLLVDSPLDQVVTPQNPPRWRHMKHACGENQLGHGSRLDSAWALRSAYDEARKLRIAQDELCQKVIERRWPEVEGQSFPESLQWEALVEVLRGRVKVHTHCYEAVDFDQFVRLSNEFQFPVAAFHHATEAYLVPDLLKQTWGGPPAIAMFSTMGRFKREAYRASQFAPKILSEAGIPVILKTDHPAEHARDLLFEAQRAHYYGLNASLALAAVTTTAASITGLDYRIGQVKRGMDADVVLWDAHPLQVGAIPRQVWIDGIPQLAAAAVAQSRKAQTPPNPPAWDDEAKEALAYRGLQPLAPRRASNVAFTGVGAENGTILVQEGRIVASFSGGAHAEVSIDLAGGEIARGLITIGSKLGLEEVDFMQEMSWTDGGVFDPLAAAVPPILGDPGAAIRAVDGLRFQTRHALLAYHAGVTVGVVSPISKASFSGVSAAMRLGEPHGLTDGAIVKDAVALHLTVGAPSDLLSQAAFASLGPSAPSISTQIFALRRLLSDNVPGETGQLYARASKGQIPLVVTVNGADAMAALIRMKRELERNDSKVQLRLVFMQAGEAHLIAKEIGEVGVGVILAPLRPSPTTYDERRFIPGPPLSDETLLTILLKHNVTVGVGVRLAYEAVNTRFVLKKALADAGGRLTSQEVLALASTNLERLLGLPESEGDFVAYHGGAWHSQDSRPVAVLSPSRSLVDVFV